MDGFCVNETCNKSVQCIDCKRDYISLGKLFFPECNMQ